MTYIERLLQRALAVPRDRAEALFDPFDQVAEWRPEDAQPDTLAGPVAAPAEVATLPAPGRTPAEPVAPPTAPVTVATTHPPPDAAPAPRDAAVTLTPAPAAPAALTAAALASGPRAESAPDPLALADAIMRSLNPKAVPQPPPETPSPTAPDEARRAPPVRPQLARSAPAAATGKARKPTLVRPQRPPPQPTPEAMARPAPAAARSAPSAKAAEDRALRAASPPAPAPARATIVVAAGPARFEDLAHSSGILRFGIGQG